MADIEGVSSRRPEGLDGSPPSPCAPKPGITFSQVAGCSAGGGHAARAACTIPLGLAEAKRSWVGISRACLSAGTAGGVGCPRLNGLNL